ncbi:MAG: hypothetical protein RI887_935, partial [Actinomycetota bacterium]
ELIAAAAASSETGDGYGNGAYLTVSDSATMTWADLPGQHTAKALIKSLRTCYTWHGNLYNEIRKAQHETDKLDFTVGAPWFDRFFALNANSSRPDVEGEDQSRQLAAFDKWAIDFLQWFQELCWSGSAREQLADIRDKTFSLAEGLKPDESREYIETLDELIIGQSLVKREQWRESVDLLKNSLADSKHRLEGVVGVVNSLQQII